MPAPAYNGFSMVRCGGCDLLHTQQRDFDLAQYDSIYTQQSAYRDMMNVARKTFDGQFGYRDLWWFKRLALRLLERHGKGMLLDVGSGPGTFLLVARERNWNVVGVEPTAEPAHLAASFNLQVFNGTVEEFVGESTERFNAVTCFEVLEHVSDPLQMLQAMRETLDLDGHLLLSVPNLDDPYCLKQQNPSTTPPVHINFFNRKSLSTVLEKAGFEVVRFISLPIPTSSVRNVHGRQGFIVRLPLLFLMRLFGRADGTVLVALARRN